MFSSFFPKPKLLFITATLWTFFLIFLWFFLGAKEFASLSLASQAGSPASFFFYVSVLFTLPYLWFYSFFLGGIFLFYLFWRIYAPHPWQNWSILGTGIIIFVTNFSIQIVIVLNSWRGSFFDLIQKALTIPNSVNALELFSGIGQFLSLAFVHIIIIVLNGFFVRHYVFRWRSSMSFYFTEKWNSLRHIEGASQRIQDDTMRFARITESLGVSLVDSVMTLIAFLPLLSVLSSHVTSLPFLGQIHSPLVVSALAWSIFGTVLLIVTGCKLPGLEFKNQRVEAALRKELVYGEDDAMRAEAPTLQKLFKNVKENYFIMYKHYVYFDMTRHLYLQTDNIFGIFILIPTVAAGKITFGVFHQIIAAFTQVSSSFQYLVNSWPTIIELISIWKRLHAFEATLKKKDLLEIDRLYFDEENKNKN